MSIATVVARGFGPSGSIAAIITRGLSQGEAGGGLQPTVTTRGFGGSIVSLITRGFSQGAAGELQPTVTIRGFGGSIATIIWRGFGVPDNPRVTVFTAIARRFQAFIARRE